MNRMIAALVTVGLLSGCTYYNKVADVKTKYLADVDTSKKLENLPFQHSWVWNDIERSNYHSVYIAPVRTDLLDDAAWQTNVNGFITSKEEYLNEVKGVAQFFREKLIEDFANYPDSKFKVASAPGAGVVVISIALVEAEFAHPGAQAVALAVPVPGSGVALAATTSPHAAFGLRLTDGGNNKLIATAADRKYPPLRIVDLNKLTVTSSLREVSANWAQEISEAVNKGKLAEVESRGTFSLLPW